MTTATEVRIRREKVRTVVFLDQEADGAPNEQQMTYTLPAGVYRVIGPETIDVREMGRTHTIEMIRLLGGKRGASVYYVHPSQLPAT